MWCKYPVASRFPIKSTSQPLHILHVKPILVVYTFLFCSGGAGCVGGGVAPFKFALPK